LAAEALLQTPFGELNYSILHAFGFWEKKNKKRKGKGQKGKKKMREERRMRRSEKGREGINNRSHAFWFPVLGNWNLGLAIKPRSCNCSH